jgi:hypothetical protein
VEFDEAPTVDALAGRWDGLIAMENAVIPRLVTAVDATCECRTTHAGLLDPLDREAYFVSSAVGRSTPNW